MKNYEDIFKQTYPQPTDFPINEYELNKVEIESAALATGYKLAGFKHSLAVFSSKK